MPLPMPSGEPGGVGDEEVVADQLAAAAELVGQQLPALPVVLGHAVLDRDDRVGVDEVGEVVGVLGGLEAAALALHVVDALGEELGGGAVEREEDVLAGLEAGGLDALHDEVEGFGGRAQVRGEAALVADGGVVAGLGEALLQGVEDLGAEAHRLGEAVGADRHHHEFLDVDRVVGMRAAVDDVHHRHRQDVGRDAADVAVERHAEALGRGLGDGEAGAEDGVGAEPALVGGAVELDQDAVDAGLVGGGEPGQGVADRAVDRLDRPAHALAAVAALVAVAQLDRLVRAGRGARGHRGAAHGAVLEQHVDLDGRDCRGCRGFRGPRHR